jgi:hypothetical protein
MSDLTPVYIVGALALLTLLSCFLSCFVCLFCWCCSNKLRNALVICTIALAIITIFVAALLTNQLHALLAGTEVVAAKTVRMARVAVALARAK